MVRFEELELCRQMKDIILSKAQYYQWSPEIIAGIISRESEFGLILDENGTGDGGHGHGLMQLDDRSFGSWIENNDWQDPGVNIGMGCRVLNDKYNYLLSHGLLDDMDEVESQRAAIAAYNCGEGNIAKVIRKGEDIDSRTAGRNYSEDVLKRSEQFKEVFT